MSETWIRGALFHPDPDILVSFRLGYHDYEYFGEAEEAYVEGEISELEFEAILEGGFERMSEKELYDYE